MRRDEAASPPLTALGVSTKGITREDGVLIAGMPGWAGLRIPVPAAHAVPRPGHLGHQRRESGHRGRDDLGGAERDSQGVYLNLGTGIAAGIVADGKVLEGAHGAAGEIGYILPDRRRSGRQGGAALPEDVPAPLEELVGGRAVPGRSLHTLGAALTMEQLTERSNHDPQAAALLEDILSELARLDRQPGHRRWTPNASSSAGVSCARLRTCAAGPARRSSELRCFAPRSNRPISAPTPPWWARAP